MVIEDASCDIRLYSLLHALGDKEEVIREAIRLLFEPDMNEASWLRVREMGREIAPEYPLFDSYKTIDQLRCDYAECYRDHLNTDDYRINDQYASHHYMISDHRSNERRRISLPWLGVDRRKGERRHFERRMT